MTDATESDNASDFELQVEEPLPDRPIEQTTPAAPPSFAIPDRADAPVSETTERFLRAITAVVPVDRIEELHLFSPLRQGGVETGIAVIAARVLAPTPEPAAPVVEPSLEPSLELPLASDAAEPQAEALEVHDVRAEAQVVVDGETADESPYAPEVVHEIVEHAVEDTLELVTEVIASEFAVAAPVERHTVYTARYRLVQKGPERGKWETDIRDEADAPLITVEMVVRGVQRRAGESSETTRYTGAQIARALGR